MELSSIAKRFWSLNDANAAAVRYVSRSCCVLETGRALLRWGLLALLLVIIAVLAVLVSWLLRSAAKGDVAKSKLFLHQKEELREQQDMQVLVGHEGRTLSVLRPSGIGDFDGVRLNVVTEGEFIENGVAIRIARVEGGKIVVKAIKS